jgi:hypothetical protein
MYVTHFVLHIRCKGKSNTVCLNRNYEEERNALFYCIQVKKGKTRPLFGTEVTKEIATYFVSNRSYKGNSNMFCFKQKLQRK